MSITSSHILVILSHSRPLSQHADMSDRFEFVRQMATSSSNYPRWLVHVHWHDIVIFLQFLTRKIITVTASDLTRSLRKVGLITLLSSLEGSTLNPRVALTTRQPSVFWNKLIPILNLNFKCRVWFIRRKTRTNVRKPAIAYTENTWIVINDKSQGMWCSG